MIERNINLIIEDTIKHYPITLVTGPRQIGKSTLLYNSFLNKGYSYISLDDSLELAMAKSDPKTFLELHQAPIIFDDKRYYYSIIYGLFNKLVTNGAVIKLLLL